jgi:hypothetical protein
MTHTHIVICFISDLYLDTVLPIDFKGISLIRTPRIMIDLCPYPSSDISDYLSILSFKQLKLGLNSDFFL